MRTANDIINAKNCGDIFENNLDAIKNEYRLLAKQYHPDVYKDAKAHDVLARLNILYAEALDAVALGTWKAENKIFIQSKSGKKIAFKFLSEKTFELGKLYIGRKHVVYLLDKEHKKFYDNAIFQINNLTYANDKMKEEFSRYFPKIEESFETNESKWCLIFSKSEDQFLLEDLLEQQGKSLDAKHVAWVVSRLSNIACYLQYKEVVHNGISLNNCFVSPSHHSISLLGGWWYATKEKQKMIGTQKAIFDIMPLKDKYEKIANPQTDLESIKLLAKLLLNIKSVVDKTIPQSMLNWLKKGSSSNAIEEFKNWNVALDSAWGARKFIKLEVKEEDIYKN